MTANNKTTRTNGRKGRKSFGGVYNSSREYDPTSTETQRIKILGFFKENPNRKLSVDDVAAGIGGKPSQTSVSSSVRDLRKKKFGGYTITSGYDTDGVFKYCFVSEGGSRE